MKKSLTFFLLIAGSLMGWSETSSPSALSDPAVQQYLAAMRAEFSSGKVDAINGVLQLTAEEAGTFWPIYQQYEEDLFAIGDRRLGLIEDFARATATDSINDAFASKLAADWFMLQADHLKLLETYYAKVAEALSPLKAAQFVQLENRFNTVTDLLIASQIPMIDPLLPKYLQATE